MTADQQERFVRELGISGNVDFAVAAAGTTRFDALACRFESPEFERRWRGAVATARRAFLSRSAPDPLVR